MPPAAVVIFSSRLDFIVEGSQEITLKNYFAGFSYAQESQIITGWSQDPLLQQKVCDIVLENALDNEALCDYWAKCLARCGLL